MHAVTSQPRGRGLRGRVAGIEWTVPVAHLCFVWALMLLDLHFFFAAMIAQPLVYIVHLGYPPLLLMMALQGPIIFATAKRWVWYPPMFLLLVVAGITIAPATNKMLAKDTAQILLIYYSIALAAAVYVRTPRQALPFIYILIGQFAWYGLWARQQGLVPWHPTLSNYDGFGTLMVPGAALAYWTATASSSRKVRLVLFALAGYCVMGVVASFARAAFLSLIALVGWVWVRSPRKMATAGGIVAAALVVVIAASVMFEPGFFYNEIMSSFDEGTSEGTGAQRWELWKAGIKVWQQHPIIGVGGGNFGAFAASHFRFGELEAFPNPNMLYGYNLHNAYMQILSEFGIVGIFAFAWAVWDFQKRNKDLRTPGAAAYWAAQTGGKFDLRYLALGLEAANIGNLLCGMFYASLFANSFYTIWIMNRILWAVTRQTAPPSVPHRARHRVASAR